MPEIKKIKAKEILDSRSEPTIEVEVETELGIFQASIPSGTSRGKYEAVELRDGVKNVNEIISPELKGKDVSQQKEIDEFLIKLDGTENKSSLGANAILGVSIAVCRAGAAAQNLALWKWISKIAERETKLPLPCILIIEGGLHSGNDLDIQEFMIVPQTEIFQKNLRIGTEIYHSLKEILKNKFEEKACNLGVEGGFAPPLKKTKEALDLITEAIRKTKNERKVKIGLDCAASHFFQEGKYNFEGEKRTGEELLGFYQDLLKEYPISFLEDPFEQDDWKSWQQLSAKCKVQSAKLLIMGDDLTVTNLERIKEAKEKEACNGIILKPNQIGTITETIAAAKLAKKFEWKIIVSHRSGETLDDFIADLAVGIRAEFIKSGAPGPAERMAKYNRLLKIEEELTENSSL